MFKSNVPEIEHLLHAADVLHVNQFKLLKILAIADIVNCILFKFKYSWSLRQLKRKLINMLRNFNDLVYTSNNKQYKSVM